MNPHDNSNEAHRQAETNLFGIAKRHSRLAWIEAHEAEAQCR